MALVPCSRHQPRNPAAGPLHHRLDLDPGQPPLRTTRRPSTRRSRTWNGPQSTSAATGSQAPAAPSPRHVPDREVAALARPRSTRARPRAPAPPPRRRVATSSVSRALMASAPCLTRCNSIAMPRLGEEVSRVVARRSVHPEPDLDARVAHPPDRRDARPEPAVRAGTVRHAGPGPGKEPDLAVVELHAVRVPDVLPGPAQILRILPRPAAELRQRIGDVLLVLRQVGVQHHPLVPGEPPPRRP